MDNFLKIILDYIYIYIYIYLYINKLKISVYHFGCLPVLLPVTLSESTGRLARIHNTVRGVNESRLWMDRTYEEGSDSGSDRVLITLSSDSTPLNYLPTQSV